MIVDRKDHEQYLTTTKGYSVDCTNSSPEQNKAVNDLSRGMRFPTI